MIQYIKEIWRKYYLTLIIWLYCFDEISVFMNYLIVKQSLLNITLTLYYVYANIRSVSLYNGISTFVDYLMPVV